MKKANGSQSLQHEVEQFLYRQSELLDGKKWQDWIDLFTDDGIYWMPPEPSYTTWDGHAGDLRRGQEPDERAHGARAAPRRLVAAPALGHEPRGFERVDREKESKNGDVEVRSRFHMMELRRDDVRHFAGLYTHHLKKTKDGFRIKLQRVDMANAQATYDYVLQVWV